MRERLVLTSRILYNSNLVSSNLITFEISNLPAVTKPKDHTDIADCFATSQPQTRVQEPAPGKTIHAFIINGHKTYKWLKKYNTFNQFFKIAKIINFKTYFRLT